MTRNWAGARSVLAIVAAVGLVGSAIGAGEAETNDQAVTSTPRPTATPDRDWDLPTGHYYTEAGAGLGGYSIADDGGVPFWSAYQRWGGVNALGYPASRRY